MSGAGRSVPPMDPTADRFVATAMPPVLWRGSHVKVVDSATGNLVTTFDLEYHAAQRFADQLAGQHAKSRLLRALFDIAGDYEADMLQELLARAGYLAKCQRCGATRDTDVAYCEFGCDAQDGAP